MASKPYSNPFRALLEVVSPLLRGERSTFHGTLPGPALQARAQQEGVEGILADAVGPTYSSILLAVQSLNSLRYLAELRRLEQCLSQAGLRVLVLKGGALLSTLYSDCPSWRPIGDLDLLPERAHFADVLRVLREAGYQDRQEGLVRNGLLIDLHTDLLGAGRIPARARSWNFEESLLWQSSLPLKAGDQGLHRLGDAHQYAHLAVHALKHSCDRLIWLVDMALLWPQIDHAQVLAVGSESGSTRAIQLSLHLLQRLLGQDPGPCASPPRGLERVYLWMAERGRQPHIAGEIVAALGQPRWSDSWAYLIDLLWPRTSQTAYQRASQLRMRAALELRRIFKGR